MRLKPEENVIRLLKKHELVLSTAESCTGGMIASSIVNVPGASAVYKEGFITYSDEVKNRLLGVRKHTLKKYKAVSRETAKEMAYGCARKAHADIAVSVTGVAGPDTEDGKPVGLVYLGCYVNGCVITKELHLHGTRQEIRIQSKDEALKMICRVIHLYA